MPYMSCCLKLSARGFKYDDEKWSRKNYFEIPPFTQPFLENLFYFIERGIFASNCKFSNKNDLLCAWRDFNKTFCDVCKYYKRNFKPQISPIFHFVYVTEV